MLTGLFRTIRELRQRRRANREVDEELRFHIEMEIQANIARGLSPIEARRQALADLGGVAQTKEAVREVRASWIDSVAQDVRFAVRVLHRGGTGWAAVAMLALAIGITTAMFTVVDALLLRPAPFENPEQLAHVYMGTERGGPGGIPMEVVRAWRDSGAFARVEAASRQTVLVDAAGTIAVRNLAHVTPGMFELLGGVRPIRGRLFDATDAGAGADDRILISEDVWTAMLGRDPDVVGRTILVDEKPLVIVGVLPSEFRFPSWTTGIWRATRFEKRSPPAYVRFRGNVPRADAERLATDLARTVDPSYTTRGYFLRVQELAEYVLDRDSQRSIPPLAAGVVLVFLVLCANVSGLLLARLTARQREFATRSALGASRGRLLRQALIEGASIGLIAVIVGTGVAWALVSLARTFLPEAFLFATLNPVDLDARALAVASLAGFIATIAAGLLPAWIGTRVDVDQSLRVTDRGGTDTRAARIFTRGFLVGQIALACMLLVGATLLVRSFVNLAGTDRGLDVEDVMVARVELPSTAFTDTESRVSAVRVLEDALRSLPGVDQVAWSYGQPPGGAVNYDGDVQSDLPGSQPHNLWVDRHVVQPAFFAIYGIPVIRGRIFGPQDAATDVIVGERLAALLWPGLDPLGRSFVMDEQRVRLRVIGVAREIHNPTLDDSADNPEFYTAHNSGWLGALAMANIRCRGACPDPALMRQRLTRAHAGVEVDYVRPAVDWYVRELARPRAAAALGFTFAVIATLAAAGGLFSVLSYGVARRRRELGIRSALGASSSQLAQVVVRDSAIVAFAGLCAGALASWWMARALASSQYGVTATDPLSCAIVISLLALAIVLASWWPARDAMRADPVTLLREE